MKNKIFDQDHIFVLQEVLRSKLFNVLVVPDLKTVNQNLYKTIKELSKSVHPLLIYVSDESPSEIALEMLTSFNEVQYILIHSNEIKEVCLQLNPHKSYILEDEQMRLLSSFAILFA